MPGDIRELDQATVDRIAAGEVVERPASVVKELVENALDADAGRVDVAVAEGGTERIEVRDDGVGMTEAEVRAAVREHTTSKLRDVAELSAGVGTLGFRGEALHAIGAVSRTTIRTRPRDGDRGTELRLAGGEVRDVGPVGRGPGTTVVVEDLFRDVPARRKYLKTRATEFEHVNRVVAGYALARPDVAVTLTHDGRETFATPGDGDRRSAVLSVYGREVADAMVAVDHEPEGPVERVHGLVSHPETTRADARYVNSYVDGRYVTSGTVREAVRAAYGRQLAGDRYPFAALFVEVPPGEVDVNVHPRKLEVRFAAEEAVRDAVEDAVEAALLDAGLLRSSAPRGKSAPEQTEIRPGDGATGPERPSGATDREPGDAGSPADPAGSEPTATADTESVRGPPGHAATAPDRSAEGAGDGDVDTGPGAGSPLGPGTDHHAPPTQLTLEADAVDAERSFDRLPRMRLLGQVEDTYLVAETDDGLVLVDQHAADERVRYERLRERFDGDVASQALASPVDVSLTPGEAELLRAHGEALAELGFSTDLREDGEPHARVHTVPALLADEGPALAREVLGAFVSGDPGEPVADRVDALLGDMACKPAITGNESLSAGTTLELLAALDDCENPWACPHGRPVLVELSSDELAARFERDYPGHG